MMNASLNQGTAMIYQFPVGGRSALAGRRYGETSTNLATTPRVNETICSGSWYHEAAIQESQNERDH
jgi:Protein of unknown function (DUF2735)